MLRIQQEKVCLFWQTGRYMREHILCHRERAHYDTQAVEQLSRDEGLDPTELWRMLQFVEAFPNLGICRELENLNWAHYRVLIPVADEKKRLEFADRASRENWTSQQLRSKIRFSSVKENGEKERLPLVCLGPFYTFRIMASSDIHSDRKELLLDLGFRKRLEMRLFPDCRLAAGTVVISQETAGGGFKLERSAVQCPAKGPHADSALYTYKAFVTRVIDGDTLKLDVRPGFGYRAEDTFRLKGIDCPEMDSSDELSKTRRAVLGAAGDKCTPSATKKADPSLNQRIQGGEGQTAKRFVESELSRAEYVTIKSTASGSKEKWGRYLVDVFYDRGGPAPVYLNQLLLDEGHAVRVRN